jgi:hypothetical protein
MGFEIGEDKVFEKGIKNQFLKVPIRNSSERN